MTRPCLGIVCIAKRGNPSHMVQCFLPPQCRALIEYHWKPRTIIMRIQGITDLPSLSRSKFLSRVSHPHYLPHLPLSYRPRPAIRPLTTPKPLPITRALTPFTPLHAHSHNTSSPFLLHCLLVRRQETMHCPVIHHSLLIVVLPGLLSLGPLIPVEFTMSLAPRAFLSRLVAVGLHPAGVAGAAVNPAGEAFTEEEVSADVITWGANGWDLDLNGLLEDTSFARRKWFCYVLVYTVFWLLLRVWAWIFTRPTSFSGRRLCIWDHCHSSIVDFCDGRKRDNRGKRGER